MSDSEKSEDISKTQSHHDTSKGSKGKISFYHRNKNFLISLCFIYIFIVLPWLFMVTGNFKLSDDTISTINQTLNIAIALLPAFLFGLLGAVCKLFLSGEDFIQNIKGVIGSGGIAVITVLSFKSGLISLIADTYFSGNASDLSAKTLQGGQYSTILISLISGMFAYNIFSMMSRAADAGNTGR